MGLLRHSCSTVGKPSHQQQDLMGQYGFGSVVSLCDAIKRWTYQFGGSCIASVYHHTPEV